jgi:Glycosyl transferase family 11
MSDVESLYMMSLCKYIIVGSSSFSWWGAYLASSDTRVIAPGSIQEGFNKEDYYLPSWTVLEEE